VPVSFSQISNFPRLFDNGASDLGQLRARVSELGDAAKAVFRFEALDLGDSEGVSSAVRHFDDEFGPISHLYVVCGLPAHLKDHPDAWKLVSCRSALVFFLVTWLGGVLFDRILHLKWCEGTSLVRWRLSYL